METLYLCYAVFPKLIQIYQLFLRMSLGLELAKGYLALSNEEARKHNFYYK